MTMNPFEQNEHLLHFLTSQVEREVIDYIRQEMQHDAPDSIPTCLLYTSPSPRDYAASRMPSSA